MTYADKYALMKAYKIITGDDPDQNKSPDRVEFQAVGNAKISTTKVQALERALEKNNISGDKITEILEKFGYKKITDILVVDYKKICDEFSKGVK